MTAIQIGLEALCDSRSDIVRSTERIGVLMNQASVDLTGHYACDLIAHRFPNRVRAIFSPQHGLWGEEQANMIETGHSTYPPLDVPLFSLYSATRRPTPEMLDRIDTLIIDLQDVGTRVYTFIWTLLNCMEACAERKVRVVVLDRPNPLGGKQFQGPILHSDYRSFVGLLEIPMRHGLTIGEFAKLAKRRMQLDVELEVVAMEGWQRKMTYPNCHRPWILPSPNMPGYRTVRVYPGGVLLEGTNISEGRGTTVPFEVVGAPFIDEFRLASYLNRLGLDGVHFRPTRFRPTFDKWRGESCRGVWIEVIDEERFDAYRSTIHLLAAVRNLFSDSLQWLPPPYEYETVKPPIDILNGSDRTRLAFDSGCTLDELDQLAMLECRVGGNEIEDKGCIGNGWDMLRSIL
ncbi:MAG: DUF1343 domain-containing protein [Pirellulales bacterium]